MTKTKLKTNNGTWWSGFDYTYEDNKLKSIKIKLTENQDQSTTLGKVEAKEVIKIAQKYCGTELEAVLI
jgi:hypothetical protein